MKLVYFFVVGSALLVCGAATAADLHPIVEVQRGYLFGATKDGNWIKADETAKALPDNTTYQIYGLTESLSEAKGGKQRVKVSRAKRRCSSSYPINPRTAPSHWPRHGMRCRASREWQM